MWNRLRNLLCRQRWRLLSRLTRDTRKRILYLHAYGVSDEAIAEKFEMRVVDVMMVIHQARPWRMENVPAPRRAHPSVPEWPSRLLDMDFSQVERRVMAAVAQDAASEAERLTGLDRHTRAGETHAEATDRIVSGVYPVRIRGRVAEQSGTFVQTDHFQDEPAMRVLYVDWNGNIAVGEVDGNEVRFDGSADLPDAQIKSIMSLLQPDSVEPEKPAQPREKSTGRRLIQLD